MVNALLDMQIGVLMRPFGIPMLPFGVCIDNVLMSL